MKWICTLLAGIVLGFTAQAQRAAGLRVSADGLGGLVQFPLRGNLNIEAQANAGGIFSGTGKSYTLAGLLKSWVPLPDKSWSFYFGLGVHGGVWDPGYVIEGDNIVYRATEIAPVAGVDGLAGIEYRLPGSDLSISADYRPAINLLGRVDYFPHNAFGIGLKLYFD